MLSSSQVSSALGPLGHGSRSGEGPALTREVHSWDARSGTGSCTAKLRKPAAQQLRTSPLARFVASAFQAELRQ